MEKTRSRLTRGERFRMAREEYNQHGEQDIVTVARAADLQQSMISDLENDRKDRDVGYQKIAALAEYYGVSMDYLAGTAANPTTDTNIQAICNYTGLSQEAIETLRNLDKLDEGELEMERFRRDLVNRILEGDAIEQVGRFLYTAARYLEIWRATEKSPLPLYITPGMQKPVIPFGMVTIPAGDAVDVFISYAAEIMKDHLESFVYSWEKPDDEPSESDDREESDDG